MKTAIVVDANVLLSALLGGKSSIILIKSNFRFTTTEYTINEVKKYLPKLSKKLGISETNLNQLLLQLPLKIFKNNYYKDYLKGAKKLIGEIDAKDVEILALALKLDTYLWTQDKHFLGIKDKIHLLKTEDLI